MAEDKKEQQTQDHIPTEPQSDTQEESKGTGGLLSGIGDPVGTSSCIYTSSHPSAFSTSPSQIPKSPNLTYLTLLTRLPTGNVLNTALRPVGAPLEKFVTGPLGEGLGGTTRGALGPLLGHEDERAEILGGKNADSYSKPEKIAGKEQTGQNPLGLDQTGRWGFEDEKKKK